MTLNTLEGFLRQPGVGSMTLTAAANGKIYATVYLAKGDGQFAPHNKWADSLDEAIEALAEKDRDDEVLV